MSEVWEISGDETGEEVEVQRAICIRCGAFEYVSLEKAKGLTDESYRCSLCWNAPGKISVKNYVACSKCGEVYDPKDPRCYCPSKTKPLLTWYHKSDKLKDPTAKRLSEQVEESKLQGLERKIVITAKQKEYERKIRVDKNLIELNKNIKKLVIVLGEKNVRKE